MATRFNKIIMPENLQAIYELVDSMETANYALSKLKQINVSPEALVPLKMAVEEFEKKDRNLEAIWLGKKQSVSPINIMEFGVAETVELVEKIPLQKPLDNLDVYLLFDEQDKVHVQYFLNDDLLDDFCKKNHLDAGDLFKTLNPEVMKYLEDLNLEINEGQLSLNQQNVASDKFIKLLTNPSDKIKNATKNLTERLQKRKVLMDGKSVQVQAVNTQMQYILEAKPVESKASKTGA